MADNPSPNPCKEHTYGSLNDVSKPHIRKRFTLDRESSIKAMAQAAADLYTPKALANVGQFKAIVLRVKPSNAGLAPEPGGWYSAFFDGEGGGEPAPQLVEIKARVPEIHSMLPIPDQLGSAPGEHQKTIDMYPTFVAMTQAVEEPMPGDLVWVDWGNRQNWTDPVYVRPVKETIGMGAGGPGGRGSHGNCSGGSYSATSPAGDSTAGKNLPVKPYSGLPRLKRVPKSKGEPKFIYGENLDPQAKADWEAAAKGLPPGVTHLRPLKSNGHHDEKHKHGKRSTLVWWANTTDFKQDWELIHWFHSAKGFSRKNFQERIVPQLKKMVSQGRNFAFVMPELPWSERGTGSANGPRKQGAFSSTNKSTWGGDFAALNNKVMKLITGHSIDSSLKFISIYGIGRGANAAISAGEAGALHAVKPNRVMLADPEPWDAPTIDPWKGGAAWMMWEEYVKIRPKVWFSVVTAGGGTATRTKTFFDMLKGEIKGRPIYHIKSGKSGKWCWNNALSIVAEEHQKRADETAKKEAAAASPANAPVDEEEAENQTAEQAANAAAEAQTNAPTPPPPDPPKREETGLNPTVQGPSVSPSEASKKKSFKAETAVPYKANRVRVKEYGGPLVGAAADKLLVEAEPGVKLHKLVAGRYRAIKKAAKEAGFSDFKISSGWRKHRWRDRTHYNQVLIEKYGDIAVGKGYLAFNSPHETGMAMDIRAHGIKSTSSTIPFQKLTPLFAWLKENAHKYGFAPYVKEPWHWECRLPYDSWASGEEFTTDFGTRVTYIGGKNAQLPSGPGSGTAGAGAGAGAGARCVAGRGGRGGSGTAGPYNPGPPFKVAGGGAMGTRLVGSPPPRDAMHWGVTDKQGKLRWIKQLTLFVLHETAGWPNGINTLKAGRKGLREKKSKTTGNVMMPSQRAVHFWGSCEGDVIQCCHPCQLNWHANCTNSHSCGIEVCGFAQSAWSNKSRDRWKKLLAHGCHIVTHNGKGDIKAEPGKIVADSPSKGVHHLSTLQQCISAWDLILWISKKKPPVPTDGPGGGKFRGGGEVATPTINLPIAFPCVPSETEFHWSKWHGAPTKSAVSAQNWFRANRPVGICAHARIAGHHDGLPLEYYCLGRAQGLSAKDAYYAMVGALCSGEKTAAGSVTGMPKKYVALGKRKFKAEWLNAKTYKWVGRKKWKTLAAANPGWFANSEIQASAQTKA